MKTPQIEVDAVCLDEDGPRRLQDHCCDCPLANLDTAEEKIFDWTKVQVGLGLDRLDALDWNVPKRIRVYY